MDFDWNRARAFLATAEAGSMSAAAQALGMSQPTVGRHVAALEEELGVALFDRVGNRLSLTTAGVELLGHVRDMRQAADRASLAAVGQASSHEGTVTVSAADAVSAHVLPPILARLRQRHRGLRIDVRTTNDPSDLLRREADVALRNFRPTEPDLVARRLPDQAARFYAASTYLDRLGRPLSRADAVRADFISFEPAEAFVDALIGRGLPVTLANVASAATNHLVQFALCCAGMGICVFGEQIGDAAPGVERVWPDEAPWMVPLWLVAHSEVRTNPRIRAVMDALASAIGDGPAQWAAVEVS